LAHVAHLGFCQIARTDLQACKAGINPAQGKAQRRPGLADKDNPEPCKGDPSFAENSAVLSSKSI
jgi:hypothetical protein